ncbi:MAG TPA: DNA polymerase III subunit alpha [Solirubrobacteraceae bacterium]|nr:DNA polymerase III subunit alpha [Solirubrobacteraceae bacterium]
MSFARASGVPYVELHCHSAYSFLDGVSLPEELARRASELGHAALALTDHNSVSGSMELAQAAPDCGIRAIHGAEIDVALALGGERGADAAASAVAAGACDGGDETAHLTLLVRDERGWRNLCRIVTLAHAHTREGSGRRELAQASVNVQDVLDHAEGLVCLTGCAERSAIGAGERGERAARRLLDAFGPEDLYVELQRPYARHDRARNRALSAHARRLGVRCVATGNVHAHAHERAQLQDAFVALRHHATLDASEPLRRGNHSHVMSTPRAMASRFAEHPDAVRETLALAERLTFDLTKDLGYRYPGAEEESAPRRLAELCAARLEERYGSGPAHCSPTAHAAYEEARGRLEEELRVIEQLGLAGFFLLHHDMLELAREVALEVRGPDSVRALLAPGRGRGSSVSSLVCYLTGLSHIDPVAGKLALGRFLHEDLQGLPDIDLDFPRDIRKRLIPRVHERYGRDRAALVAAFPTYRARGAIRELGKVLGLPAGEIERVARGAASSPASSPEGEGEPWGKDLEHVHAGIAGARSASTRWRWLARLVEQAQGLPRHLSQHSGGMVIATRPLIDCCPVVPAAMDGRQMVQWDKDSCADAGFLKIDLLGLGMLSAVERCVEEIARVRGERVDLSRIPYDDPDTFRAIRAADTVGVFQIESRAQMQSLLRTRPRSLQELTIQVAIVRPGPIQGGAINPYIERLQRLRTDPAYEIPYPHPALAPALAETLGTIIFQDQVMQVAEAFAGYSAGEAAALRRAMSRKRSQEMIQGHRERFVEGAIQHVGAERPTAERVWGMIEGFAGFGFPKAHSAAFGLLAYQSTWLRVHYGAEFLCALLNEQPMGFYAPDSLVHEAQNRGIAVLGVDVNASQVRCTVEDGAVRIGLGYIKDVASTEMRELVAERERGGPFASLGDLAGRVGCRRGTLEQLAWSGACDGLAGGSSSLERTDAQEDRRAALWRAGMVAPAVALGRADAGSRAQAGGDAESGQDTQLALPLELGPAPSLRALGRWQRLIADYSTSGVTVGEHAMSILRPRLDVPALATSAQLARLPSGCQVAVAGLVIARQRPGTAKGTMFLLFEDEFGAINLIVPKVVYERHRHLARAEPLLLAKGRLERTQAPIDMQQWTPRAAREGRRGEAEQERVRPVVNVIVRELTPLEHFLAGGVEGVDGVAEGARVHRLPDALEGAPEGAEVGSSMRAAVPPMQSFGAGRRR